MEYTNLQKGDVILVNNKGIYNFIVRLFTTSSWGHSIMYIGDNMFIESNKYGVMIKTMDLLGDSYCRVFRNKGITKKLQDLIVEEAMSKQESGYDFLAIIQIAIQILFGKRFEQSEIGDEKKWFCSELVAAPYYKFKLPVLQGVKPNAIIPADFERSPYFYRVEQ